MGKDKIIPVIDLKGAIAAGGRGLSFDALEGLIESAFSVKGAVAVALDINCPGGSPAQSELIANLIRRKSEETGLKVYAFSQDVVASGGYWLACAADEIYAPQTALIGSIGVVTSQMSYSKLFDKLGIEERTYTAGKNKSTMSPNKPEDPKSVAETQQRLDEMHKMFKDWVVQRRGKKLDSKLNLEEDVFDGSVFHAQKAVDIGLIDGIAEMKPFLHKKFGNDVQVAHIVMRGGAGSGTGLSATFNNAAEDKGFMDKFTTKLANAFANAVMLIVEKKNNYGDFSYDMK
jgi:serine protease SohB